MGAYEKVLSRAQTTAEERYAGAPKRNSDEIIESISLKLMHHYRKDIIEATPAQLYKAAAMTVRDDIMRRYTANEAAAQKRGAKQLYYLSVEFLMGRALTSNIINLNAAREYAEAFGRLGLSFDALEEREPEAGPGPRRPGRARRLFPRFARVAPGFPRWAAASGTNTACSGRRSWTARSRNCPITGSRTATSGR